MGVRNVLLTGATGFIGRALLPALVDRGHAVRATTRLAVQEARPRARVEWTQVDLLQPETLKRALEGMDSAYYLVHSLTAGHDYRARDRKAAQRFARAAAQAGLERIVYLGGVAPPIVNQARASEHLQSRLEVGEILRAGRVPAIELRASMIIGQGSASWQIVRDLARRLPAMILPAWLRSRTCPVALEDVVTALVDALDLPLSASAWFDLPGPEILSAEEILQRVAALDGRRAPTLPLPVVTPRLSALWLRLITGASFPVARELVLGLRQDLLPVDARYWELTAHHPRIPFDEAARRALLCEPRPRGLKAWLVHLEEALVRHTWRARLPTPAHLQ